MSQERNFTKIDLTRIIAIAHDNFTLQILVKTETGYQLKNFAAPYQAYEGLQQISRSIASNETSQLTTKSREQLLVEMEMLPVISSTIVAIGYCSLLEVLQVDFVKGERYRYYQVPAFIFDSFLNASSKGRFLNTLKTEYNFSYERIS